MTRGLSKHTMLMNKMIGLATKAYGWPSPLNELGYKVDLIEPKFVNAEGKKVVADVSFKSNKLVHILINECKTGNIFDDIAKDQLIKYTKLTLESIKSKITVFDPNRLQSEVCYSVENENRQIINDINQVKNVPVLIFSDSTITKENAFDNKELDDKFSSPIAINSKPPTQFYPFSDQDDLSIIALEVFPELLDRVSRKTYLDDLLRGVHPFWDNIEEHKKKDFRRKVEKVLYNYKDLSAHLKRIKSKRGWEVRSLQKFAENCKKIIDDLSRQKTLNEFPKSTN